jgi:8-hydroxy-5-deazaflavin:NADPH oxidoreductase
MQYAVLGTGVVGQTIATKLVTLGHEVRLGSRSADNPAAVEWAAAHSRGSATTFADAATFGEVVVNCLPGAVVLAVLEALAEEVGDKVLIDVSNPLDFSQGLPPTLSVCNTDSLAEQIQRALPSAKVVKALNTVNADIMVNPGLLSESTDLFLAGNDDQAKASVRSLLVEFGWRDEFIHDCGQVSTARGLEMYLLMWLNLMGATGSAHFNIHVVRADGDPPTG